MKDIQEKIIRLCEEMIETNSCWQYEDYTAYSYPSTGKLQIFPRDGEGGILFYYVKGEVRVNKLSIETIQQIHDAIYNSRQITRGEFLEMIEEIIGNHLTFSRFDSEMRERISDALIEVEASLPQEFSYIIRDQYLFSSLGGTDYRATFIINDDKIRIEVGSDYDGSYLELSLNGKILIKESE